MSRPIVEAEYECPHCGEEYVLGAEAIFIDDIADENIETCDRCGGAYQVRSVEIDVELEVCKWKP